MRAPAQPTRQAVDEAAACAADAAADLVAAGVTGEQLAAFFDALSRVLDGAPATLDQIVRAHWRGDAERVCDAVARLRNAHVRAAAQTRRRNARLTQPAELAARVDELLRTGQARSRRKACELLAAELHKSTGYIERRERQGRKPEPDTSR